MTDFRKNIFLKNKALIIEWLESLKLKTILSKIQEN